MYIFESNICFQIKFLVFVQMLQCNNDLNHGNFKMFVDWLDKGLVDLDQ